MQLIRFSGIQAVYFDLDDTLCGYWTASKRALRETFEKHAPARISPDQLLDAWAAAFREYSPVVKNTDWYQTYLKLGEPTRTEQMRLTLARLDVIDHELTQLLSQSYGELRDQHLALFADANEVLAELAAEYPLGLITNGPADIQRQEIATLGIEKFFSHILIEGEMGEGKPLLSVFRRAEKLVNAPPETIVVVGNSYGHDIRPAIEAGWRTVWIRRETDVAPSRAGVESKPELKPSDAPAPDAEIHDLSELLPMLLPKM